MRKPGHPTGAPEEQPLRQAGGRPQSEPPGEFAEGTAGAAARPGSYLLRRATSEPPIPGVGTVATPVHVRASAAGRRTTSPPVVPDQHQPGDLNQLWEECAARRYGMTPFERIDEAVAVYDLFVAIAPRVREFRDIGVALERCIARARKLARAGKSGAGYARDAQVVTREIEEVGREIAAAQRKVPAALLRRGLFEFDVDDDVLAHCLRFQFRHAEMSPIWWSHSDCLLTRSVASVSPAGRLVPRPARAVAALWQGVLPTGDCTREERAEATAFFCSVELRLAGISDPLGLFTTGIFSDVIGHKFVLRSNYFDPGVLFAAGLLNVAIHNWAAERGGAADLALLDEQYKRAYADVHRVFESRAKSAGAFNDVAEELRRRRAEQEKEPAKEGPEEWTPPKLKHRPNSRFRKFVALACVGIMLGVGVPLFWDMAWTWAGDLDDAGIEQAERFHPILQNASFGGTPVRLLVADVDPDEWDALGKSERKEVARKILNRLIDKDMWDALIKSEDAVVIQIRDRKVLLVQ